MSFLIGIDVGSSSIKVALMETATGRIVGQAQEPEAEMEIISLQPGWAEQHPDLWWRLVQTALRKALVSAGIDGHEVAAIGIAYQMHGLVLLDRHHRVVRPAIIWCDSRAVAIGEDALRKLGPVYCLSHYLNAPGNFTASKLAWVKQHEPEVFARAAKAMLPGDYIALQLTGEVSTTAAGLSEGILWDYKKAEPAYRLLQDLGISPDLLPNQVATFSRQGGLRPAIAAELGLKPGIPVSYRAGDQPNNAFALHVLQPGEVAATAGTSGVIYAVTNQPVADEQSRVNTFVHVNDAVNHPRNGVLLCINGTGIFNSWYKRLLGRVAYPELNALAATVAVGADGLLAYPFGNGAERLFSNQLIGAHLTGIDLNRHGRAHIARASQEGIVFAMAYGFDILQSMGLHPTVIRVGHANMFLSPVFREAFVNCLQVPLERYETDGAAGAARGAGIGAGLLSWEEAFLSLRKLGTDCVSPDLAARYQDIFGRWKEHLQRLLSAKS